MKATIVTNRYTMATGAWQNVTILRADRMAGPASQARIGRGAAVVIPPHESSRRHGVWPTPVALGLQLFPAPPTTYASCARLVPLCTAVASSEYDVCADYLD